MFDVKICLNEKFFKMPRKGDKWLMQLFVVTGFSKDSLLRLNIVRVHQHVLFLSCILGASGKILDKKYTIRRKPEESWSGVCVSNRRCHGSILEYETKGARVDRPRARESPSAEGHLVPSGSSVIAPTGVRHL